MDDERAKALIDRLRAATGKAVPTSTFGLYAVLTRLGAEADWYAVENALTDELTRRT